MTWLLTGDCEVGWNPAINQEVLGTADNPYGERCEVLSSSKFRWNRRFNLSPVFHHSCNRANRACAGCQGALPSLQSSGG